MAAKKSEPGAYQRWKDAGGPEGRSDAFWYQAEKGIASKTGRTGRTPARHDGQLANLIRKRDQEKVRPPGHSGRTRLRVVRLHSKTAASAFAARSSLRQSNRFMHMQKFGLVANSESRRLIAIHIYPSIN